MSLAHFSKQQTTLKMSCSCSTGSAAGVSFYSGQATGVLGVWMLTPSMTWTQVAKMSATVMISARIDFNSGYEAAGQPEYVAKCNASYCKWINGYYSSENNNICSYHS